ncbi:MAG: hypothetical protein AB1458_08275 [Bacteroidota bacterium]
MKLMFIFILATMIGSDQYKCGDWFSLSDYPDIEVQYCKSWAGVDFDGKDKWNLYDDYFRVYNGSDKKVKVSYKGGAWGTILLDKGETGYYTWKGKDDLSFSVEYVK